MPAFHDGPASTLFRPVVFSGNADLSALAAPVVSESMARVIRQAPSSSCTGWGIPFNISERVVLLKDQPVTVKIRPCRARWLVFCHTSDTIPLECDEHGFARPPRRGTGRLKEHAADYVVLYADGREQRCAIRRRHELGMFQRCWGENSFESVPHGKPLSVRPHHEQAVPSSMYGWSQTRGAASSANFGPWTNWLWAWQNPRPETPLVGFRFEPLAGTVLLSAISAGKVDEHPLRWDSRQKAVLTLPKDTPWDGTLDDKGLLAQIRLDLGQVISAAPRPCYPNDDWARTYNNKLPQLASREILVEYAAHPEARFHLVGGRTVAVAALGQTTRRMPLQVVAPATQRVTLRVVDRATRRPVAVKLHMHGEAGEYLAPVDRHRIVNPGWFEDYSVDFAHCGQHFCTYIPGETRLLLPLGRVYIEVSKGFEMRPVRKVVSVTPGMRTITIPIEKVLPWREKGWVTADTHVHFLSPSSAQLEGAGEGVNVVNLLASQWGELMTNVGDFDGRTTFGARAAGGDGEYLVRVGTENRQHVLGHISLLGYDGRIIAPMTTGGQDESAIGDPVECLLTEWARQCRAQNGVVVIPHFPNPRAEHAATIVSGDADAVEMTSWGNLYGGIDPFSLCDWYRYLNCGYFVAAVGGTDKMSATTAVGTIRTYAKMPADRAFDYEAWKLAIRKGHTFVTYGPLLELTVDGQAPGARIEMSATGGTVDVVWKVASVTVPMTKVELVVNGEIKESRRVDAREDAGHWRVKVDRSSWMALLVRGGYRDQAEQVAAHSSPVMLPVKGSPFFAAADAITILDQIEGALAFLDTVGTRAETKAYRRMRLVLTGAHRALHNRLHAAGYNHQHTVATDHREHHR
jgi:hypothetical protein